MAVKCIECGKYLSPLAPEAAICNKCKKGCHKSCVGLPPGVPVSKSWLCPECQLRATRSPQIPVKVDDAQNKPDGSASCAELKISDDKSDEKPTGAPEVPPFNDWKIAILEEMHRISDDIKHDFSEKLGAVREEFLAFRHEMSEVRGAIAACCDRMNIMEERLVALEKNGVTGVDQEMAKVIQTLESTVTQLKLDINDRDQEGLLNDLDLTGISEESGENPVHIVLTCASKLGMKLEEADIVSCARVGSVHKNEDGTPRPRPIAVKLTRRSTRDAMLKAARVRRSTTTEGVGARSAPEPFYVNERLTKKNRALFNRTRKVRSCAEWKYVWTQDGKIFVRQLHGSKIYRIRSEADLDRVFGHEIVRSVDDSTSG